VQLRKLWPLEAGSCSPHYFELGRKEAIDSFFISHPTDISASRLVFRPQNKASKTYLVLTP